MKAGVKLDRVEARNRLKPRRDPYWQRVAEGRFVGFRKMTAGTQGTWLARFYNGEKYGQKKLGSFIERAERERYDAAMTEARTWFTHLDHGGTTVARSVKQACEAYVENRRTEKSEAAANDAKGRFKRLVDLDPIGGIELGRLSSRQVSEWKARVLEKGGTRGSFNRNAAALRAALALAYRRREVASDHAWREELKPFKNAAQRRKLYLNHDKRRRLIERASDEARPFFLALNLLPLRPGELAALRVENLTAQRSLEIPAGKTRARTVPLAESVYAHFKACAKGKLPGAWLVSRADGAQWKKEAWRDEIKAAAHRAKLPQATVAYTLRHSVITDLVVGGLDLFTVATVSGTSVLMIQNHYGQLQDEHARNALEKLALP